MTTRHCGVRPAWLVDGAERLRGEELAGLPIRAPSDLFEALAAPGPPPHVMVMAWGTHAVARIFGQLRARGLVQERDFTDCSTVQFPTMCARLEQHMRLVGDEQLFRAVRGMALTSRIDNRSSIAGTWLMVELMRHQLLRLAGDAAEAGVYKGGSALVALSLAAAALAGRRYHLLDSFEGLPPLSAHDPASRAGEFGDVSFADVRDAFAAFDAAHVHVGRFDTTLPDLVDREFCFAYLDCDLYEPTRDCSRFFYDRMKPGGMILVHDYWVHEPGLPPSSPDPFTGVRRAMDELCEEHGETVIRFPETTHAVVVKGGAALW